MYHINVTINLPNGEVSRNVMVENLQMLMEDIEWHYPEHTSVVWVIAKQLEEEE